MTDRIQYPRLTRAPDGQLVFQADATKPEVVGCRVERCFPWSMPDRHLSIRDKDGNELYLFDGLGAVPDAGLAVVLDELNRQEFVPRIERIRSVDDAFDITIWTVDTDRGAVEFQVKEDEDIRRLEDDRVLIRDHRGMRFEIADISALDAQSRMHLDERLS
jgi:hypothetical protein